MKKVEVFHQLQQAYRTFIKGLGKILEPHGISPSEWAIIWNIKEYGPMSQANLASFLSIEPPAISTSLSRLEKKKLIKRKSGRLDKRERMVFLAEKALSQIDQWEKLIEDYRCRLLVNISEEQQKVLYELLTTMYLTTKQQEDR